MKDLRQFNHFRDSELEAIMLRGFPFNKNLFGYFLVPLKSGIIAQVAADNAFTNHDFEHVSVSLPDCKRCPTWNEMCEIKDMFFDDEEAVFQIHPPKSEYVNLHEYCLHLWKPKKPFPRPHWISVL